MNTAKRIFISVAAVIFLLLLILCLIYFQYKPAKDINFGLTFSPEYAQSLGLTPKEVFLDMLADLKPKKIRLMAYWEDLEKDRGSFQFAFMDEMLIEAQKRNVDVVLVLGIKQPRWPECHLPRWYDSLNEQEKEQATLDMIDKSVSHFKTYDAIKLWQVENEPFFKFGPNCDKIKPDMVRKETDLVRQLDHRPVMITDSGEMGFWWKTIGAGADILGVTMYRVTYSEKVGYHKYPLPPQYYRLKAGLTQILSGKRKIVGVELQMEPWFQGSAIYTDLDLQKTLMNPKVFDANIAYAKKAGFEDNYLWGVEWWYWMAKKQNDWGMWAKAKELFQ